MTRCRRHALTSCEECHSDPACASELELSSSVHLDWDHAAGWARSQPDGSVEIECRTVNELRRHVAALHAQVTAQNGTIRALITAPTGEGVPGEWTCDACGFVLSTRTMHVMDGSVSVRAVTETPTCPNDGQSLRSLTWRELAECQREGIEDLAARTAAAEAALAAVHDELYSNASVSLEFAVHDLTSKRHHTEKTVGLVNEAQQSIWRAVAAARAPRP